LLLAAIAALACAPGAAGEDAYPARPIRLIVPFPPGGPTDVMGRLIGQAVSDVLGQQIYIDNRPGAGSTLAGKIAATAEPDGYTLLLGSAATLAIGPTLYRDVEYDPKSFVPVAMVAEVPYVMVAGPKAPVGSVGELIAMPRRIRASSISASPTARRRRCWRRGLSTSPISTSFSSPIAAAPMC
jgi:tripartite-type tricarboxylate transporter receptor subunit TctC